MRYSLVSREVICDSIETVVAGQGLSEHAMAVAIKTCLPRHGDASTDRPSVFVRRNHQAGRGASRHRLFLKQLVNAAERRRNQLIAVEKTAIPGPVPAAGCTL